MPRSSSIQAIQQAIDCGQATLGAIRFTECRIEDATGKCRPGLAVPYIPERGIPYVSDGIKPVVDIESAAQEHIAFAAYHGGQAMGSTGEPRVRS